VVGAVLFEAHGEEGDDVAVRLDVAFDLRDGAVQVRGDADSGARRTGRRCRSARLYIDAEQSGGVGVACGSRVGAFCPRNWLPEELAARTTGSRLRSLHSAPDLAATVDKSLSDAYRHSMFARCVAMLAILAIAVVTTVTSGHAARMNAVAHHAVQVGGMMQAHDYSGLFCDGEQHCGSADAGLCEFVCASPSVFLPSPSGDGGRDYSPASYDLTSGALHASRSPALNEHPPKRRLL
jgi:hypothetical protein